MDQTIDVQLYPVTVGNSFQWEMTVAYGGGNPSPRSTQYPPLDVTAKGSATITFTINNKPGQQIVFDPDHPFFVSPFLGKGAKNPGIKSVTLNDPKQLVVEDGNGDKVSFPYMLKFVGAPPLDPIVNNGGGGPGNMSQLYMLVGSLVSLAAFAAGYALAYYWR